MWNTFNKVFLLTLTLLLPSFAGEPLKTLSQAEGKIQKSLNKFCLDCHYEKKQKGDLRLDNFSTLTNDLKFDVLNKVEELLYLEKMPPKDEDILPTNAERKEKHHGTGIESPWVIMSGKNCNLDIAGRYIRLPQHGTEDHQSLGNWYTSLLNSHGNPIHHYGDLDSTMSRKKLAQEGPIKRFLKA
jgi:hypothetical protein